jgi:hypothetical protein
VRFGFGNGSLARKSEELSVRFIQNLTAPTIHHAQKMFDVTDSSYSLALVHISQPGRTRSCKIVYFLKKHLNHPSPWKEIDSCFCWVADPRTWWPMQRFLILILFYKWYKGYMKFEKHNLIQIAGSL